MKRQLLTEILLQECPNCGAARLDRETTCRFCDTALVQVKRTTVIASKKPYEDTKLGAGPDLSIDVSGDPAYQADIVSTVRATGKSPLTWRTLPVVLVFGLLSAFPVIYVMIVHEASAGRALLLLIPAALIVAVAIGLAYQPLIEPYHKYRKIMKYGTEYEATVIGVLSGVAKKPDQWVISDNGSSYSLKVTAQINGRETDVILRLLADTPVQECPVGSRIKIKGITDKENGKEYNDFVLV